MPNQFIHLPEQHLVVPQVNEIDIVCENFPVSVNRRTLPSRNKLIYKRESDRVSEGLANVVYKPNSVAVAVTRLQGGGGPPGSHGGTPEEGVEETVDKKPMFLDTSQLLKLSGTRTVSPSPSHGRLHSIRN